MSQEVLLSVKDLRTEFFSSKTSSVTAIKDVSFDMYRGEVLGLVGESGCGKSVTSLSIMQLLKDTPGKVTNGSATLDGVNLVEASDAQIRDIRGGKMSMIFQEPMTALNPVFTVGDQIAETLMLHEGLERRAAWERAEGLLAEVGIPEPAIRVRNYPFELSGGMRQRVMIAIALACRPAVLIADEPTTALDVSVQAQIFRLLKDTQRRLGTAILFITHDMGSIATMADRVIVMYAGRCVESGTAEDILLDPRHPYTQGLIACIPHLCRDGDRRHAPLREIPGMVPSIRDIGPGCAFAPRCALAKPACSTERPPFTTSGGRGTACFRAAPPERSFP